MPWSVIHAAGVSINDFMAEVVTNDQFSGLYISSYGGGGGGGSGPQPQQQQRHIEKPQQAQAVVGGGGGGNGGADGTVDYRSNLDAYVEYADSLAKCGRVCESLDLYARCFRVSPMPASYLWHVTGALLELIRMQADEAATSTTTTTTTTNAAVGPLQQQQKQPSGGGPFECGVCGLVLRDPVTLLCGHTFCRRCATAGGASNKPLTCHECGVRTPYQPHANVLIKSLVEKLWSAQLQTSELLDEGTALYRQDKLHLALLKLNQAYYSGKLFVPFFSRRIFTAAGARYRTTGW